MNLLAPQSSLNRWDIAAPHRYPLTTTVYHQLANLGVFNEDARLELIEGDLIAMPPIGERHASQTRRLNQLFSRQVGDVATVDVQNPVALSAYSEPQPDIMLLKPRADFYEQVHPGPADVLLIIEQSAALRQSGHSRSLGGGSGAPAPGSVPMPQSGRLP